MRVLPILLVAWLALPAVPAQVGPDAVCATNPVMGAASGEPRHFCEPLHSAGFIQFDQFTAGLQMLEDTHPDFIEVFQVGRSLGGLPILFVEVTNEGVPREGKLQVGYSASIHANEAAGREGMTRVIEDLAAGVGPYGAELRPLLDQLIVNVWFPNPDSWASGDYFDADAIAGVHDPRAGTGFDRYNLNGTDLNRQFPNPGWILPSHLPMNEPEAKAVVQELRYSGNHTDLVAGADLHGMVDSPNMVRSIIPNQDYDFRRMVLVVEQLRQTQARVESDPAYAEWQTADEIASTLEDALPAPPGGLPVEPCVPNPLLGDICADNPSDVHDKPFLWGARWDQIGYTDSGFTSDYLTLSPRSPTGGMGAVGTIVEFAYSHMIPDNKYVAKLTDMHVAGVRQIVRTQMEMTLRLDTPVLAGTGPIGFLDDGSHVSSASDPKAYSAGAFDLDDPERRFDFDQVAYDVSNLDFWRDLVPFATDGVVGVSPDRLNHGGDPDGEAPTDALSTVGHFAITDQSVDSLDTLGVEFVLQWVERGGHLLLTDSALRLLDRERAWGEPVLDGAVKRLCAYIGHSDLEDRSHPLLADVDWNARVTGEASATGFGATEHGARNYPVWGVERAAFEAAGGEVVGTTQGSDSGDSPSCEEAAADRRVTLGRIALGAGSIDLIGAALPMPTQEFDHRYGLAPYSVSALVYWVMMNSFGGHIEWQPLDAPFVPSYPDDPLYGEQVEEPAEEGRGKGSPMPVLVGLAAVGLAVVLRRRQVG